MLRTPRSVLESISFGQRIKPVDATWFLNPEIELSTKRIENSVRFDLDSIRDVSSPLPHMLPPPNVFQKFVDNLSLSRSRDTILIYSQPGSFSSARAWWTFKCFGFDAFILQWGLKRWEEEGGVVTSGPPPLISTSQQSDPIIFNPKLVVSFEQVKRASETGEAIICDARSAKRFYGEEIDPRPGLACGHIPSSLNFPCPELFFSSDFTEFKSVEELKSIFAQRKIDIKSQKPIISSCGSGVTACALSFALQLCGRAAELCPVYDGSWAEWGSKMGVTKETSL